MPPSDRETTTNLVLIAIGRVDDKLDSVLTGLQEQGIRLVRLEEWRATILVEAHELRITSLEHDRSIAQGGQRALRLAFALVGGVVGALASGVAVAAWLMPHVAR